MHIKGQSTFTRTVYRVQGDHETDYLVTHHHNSGAITCNCSAFTFRTGECKHCTFVRIRAAFGAQEWPGAANKPAPAPSNEVTVRVIIEAR